MPPGTAQAPSLLDAFLLRGREDLVGRRSRAQEEAIARYHAAALRRIRVARDLHESSDAVIAVTLYREPVVLLIAALRQGVETGNVEPARSVAEAFRELDALDLRAGGRPETLACARELLADPDLLAADTLSLEESAAAVAAVVETVDWLESVVEPRTARTIRRTRALRLAGAGLLAAYLLVKLGTFVAGPRNLALGKPASASSQRSAILGATNVNNGVVESRFGLHTNPEANPWVQIDLGAPVAIREVRVYNRGDGYQTESLPLVLQLSDDGRTFADVERRDALFTDRDPWVAKTPGRTARFVRLQMPKSGYIALSEVEVY